MTKPERPRSRSTASPKTVEEAVAFVLSRMDAKTKKQLRSFSDELDLKCFLAADVQAGMNVRAMLGLWSKKRNLLKLMPPAKRHADSASTIILVQAWKKLRREIPST